MQTKPTWTATNEAGAKFYYYAGLGWIDSSTGLVTGFTTGFDTRDVQFQPDDATHVWINRGTVKFLKAHFAFPGQFDLWEVAAWGDTVKPIKGIVVALDASDKDLKSSLKEICKDFQPADATHVQIHDCKISYAKRTKGGDYCLQDDRGQWLNRGSEISGTLVRLSDGYVARKASHPSLSRPDHLAPSDEWVDLSSIYAHIPLNAEALVDVQHKGTPTGHFMRATKACFDWGPYSNVVRWRYAR